MTKEYLDKIIQLVTAALGLVAALAWNEAVQDIINLVYPAGDDLIGKLIYAVIITALAVWVTTSLARVHDKLIEKEERAEKRTKSSKVAK